MSASASSSTASAPHGAFVGFCPTCQKRVPRFEAGGARQRPNAKCPACGALERHRFLAVLLDGLGPVLTHEARVLDIAPSRYTTRHLQRLGPAQCVQVDLDPEADGRAVDVQASLTRLPFVAGSFDVVLCYHVLEHVPDDRAAMAELARVLRPGGVALVQVPFRADAETEEDPEADEEERVRRFGQADHVRRYGADFERRLERAGLTGPRILPEDVLGAELCETFGVQPHKPVWLLRPADAGATARVARLKAPASGLLTGLRSLPLPGQEDELAARKARIERLVAERDRLRRQRDTWRARHERLTQHPVVRAASAPYRWWRRRS